MLYAPSLVLAQILHVDLKLAIVVSAYTAAYLHYALENIMIPVILTGSQRPFFRHGSDAPSNLCYSFKAASCGIPGVYILFDRNILYGSRATKLHTTDDNAFASPDVYAGRIEDDIICIVVIEDNEHLVPAT